MKRKPDRSDDAGEAESGRDRKDAAESGRNRKGAASAKEPKKTKNPENSSDEEDTDRDSGDQDGEDSSEGSSSDSGLEELEKKGTGALEVLFDAEAPAWVDQDLEDDGAPEHLEKNRSGGRSSAHSRRDPQSHSPASPRRATPDGDDDRPAVKQIKQSRSPPNIEDAESATPPTKKRTMTVTRPSGLRDEGGDQEHSKSKKKRSKERTETTQQKKDRRRKQRNGEARKPRGRPIASTKKANAKVTAGRTIEEPARGGVSRTRAKRKHDEESNNSSYLLDILWADCEPDHEDRRRDRTSKRPCKAPRNVQSPSDSELDSDVDSEDESIELVVSPSRQRLSLKEQHPRVQKVAIHAIRELEAHLCLFHAFPESGADSAAFIRRALANSAKAVGDSDMRKILKNEKQKSYAKKLGSIPVQHLSLFRGKVKKTTDNMVRGFFGISPGNVDKLRLLQDGIGYIYPFDHTTNTFQGDSAYSPRIFEEVLQAHFFSKPCSFGWTIVNRFTSSIPDKLDEKEIPAAMLALVSTAIFASLEDYRSSRFTTGEFRTDHFLDAYKQNTEVLTLIKNGAPLAYHDIMHSLFVRVTGSKRTGQGPAKSYLDVAAMARRSAVA